MLDPGFKADLGPEVESGYYHIFLAYGRVMMERSPDGAFPR